MYHAWDWFGDDVVYGNNVWYLFVVVLWGLLLFIHIASLICLVGFLRFWHTMFMKFFMIMVSFGFGSLEIRSPSCDTCPLCGLPELHAIRVANFWKFRYVSFKW